MPTEILEDNFLESMRLVCDEHADNFISSIIQTNSLNSLNYIFKELVYNKEIKTDEMPQYFKDYFLENSALPPWADQSKIKLAQDTFRQYGPSMVISYFCKSLPECYACGKGAEVLFKTGRLTDHVRRRVAQTAQFVLNVMAPGGMTEQGRGVTTAVKVRLMHASIRYYINQDIKNANHIKYNKDELGEPINQEDLAGTMLAFSVVVVKGIEKMGLKPTKEEKEAILHLWSVVGYLIGIKENILPTNYEQAEELWNKITKRNYKRTDAGVELNEKLIDLLEGLTPGRAYDDVTLIFMHRLIDKNAKEHLDLNKFNFYNPLSIVAFILGILFLKFESEGFLAKYFSSHINLKMLKAMGNFISEGEDTGIYIPPDLQDDWNMNLNKS